MLEEQQQVVIFILLDLYWSELHDEQQVHYIFLGDFFCFSEL